jgi:ADP-dependent NAD(P)H-hydrate dehydratase / NAD(P)H-hydrate epimerase
MAEYLDWEQIKLLLPKRRHDSSKGDYGHVLVVGGDYGMGGAVRMAAEAAMRVGAGLVSVATRPEHVPVVTTCRPEIMCHQISTPADLDVLIARATVLVIGPGLGKREWSRGLFNKLLTAPQPKIVDADGLNLLAETPAHHDEWILTPHPGEASRLLKCDIVQIQEDREAAAKNLQIQYGGVIVLKGSGTLVQSAHAEPVQCAAGNPGMASGGMGDVLSGVIGGLVAQKLSLNDAARAGVLIHSLAADKAATHGGERGLLACDLLPFLRTLVNPDSHSV